MSSQKSFKVAEEGRKRVSERNVATEEWSERWSITGFEHRGRGHKPRNRGNF